MISGPVGPWSPGLSNHKAPPVGSSAKERRAEKGCRESGVAS